MDGRSRQINSIFAFAKADFLFHIQVMNRRTSFYECPIKEITIISDKYMRTYLNLQTKIKRVIDAFTFLTIKITDQENHNKISKNQKIKEGNGQFKLNKLAGLFYLHDMFKKFIDEGSFVGLIKYCKKSFEFRFRSVFKIFNVL